MIKLMTKKWVKLVTRMGRTEMLARFCRENLKERDYLKDVPLDGRIFSAMRWRGLRCFASMWGHVAGSYEQGNVTSGYTHAVNLGSS